MYRNSELRKAIAFSLFIKTKVKSSAVPRWTVNKLHDITGVSALAIRKRLATLRAYGLVEETGAQKRCLVFKSLKSHTSHRNTEIKEIIFTHNDKSTKNAHAQNVKFIEDILAVTLMMEIQNHKNYAKQMIRQSKQPKGIKELKDARKACNHYGYGINFSDNGISYRYIAQKLGICVQTAFNIVEFGVRNHILHKSRNIQKRFLSCVKYMEDMLSNYTYIRNNIIYKISANRYRWYGM